MIDGVAMKGRQVIAPGKLQQLPGARTTPQ